MSGNIFEKDNSRRVAHLFSTLRIPHTGLDIADPTILPLWQLQEKPDIVLPQVFVNGKFFAGFAEVERSHELGNLIPDLLHAGFVPEEVPVRCISLPALTLTAGEKSAFVKLTLDAPAYLGDLTLQLVANDLLFEPNEVHVPTGAYHSTAFTISAPPTAKPQGLRVIAKACDNNHNGFVDSNTYTVEGLTIIQVYIEHVVLVPENPFVRAGVESCAIAFELDTSALGGDLELIPKAAGVTFQLNSVTVRLGRKRSTTFVTHVPYSGPFGDIVITLDIKQQIGNYNHIVGPYLVQGLKIIP